MTMSIKIEAIKINYLIESNTGTRNNFKVIEKEGLKTIRIFIFNL
ncbi:MAG: hypothetical protein ACI90V_007776 [Bacillariaceae sp.]|jgi:hypothetical protein